MIKIKKAFSLVEIMVVLAILSSVFAMLFTTFSVGRLGQMIITEQLNLKDQARRAIYLLSQDLRKTNSVEIKSNNSTDIYLKFRVYEGYDIVSAAPIWSTDYIEYTYNSTDGILTRTAGNSQTVLNDIVVAPFGIDASWIAGTDKRILVTINTSKTVLSNITVNYNLSSYVTLRN